MGHAIAVGATQRETKARGLRQRLGDIPALTLVAVLQHVVGIDDIARRVIETGDARAAGVAGRRVTGFSHPAWARIHSSERRLRRRQIGVDVVDAVDVLRVDVLAGADDAAA